MEKKEKILSKINLKDYTNHLEKILEKKEFSLQTKNLLLSMVYKIENAYQDYAKTKVEVYDKGVFLDKIIQIIDKDCSEIELINNKTKENHKIEKEKQKITTVGSELNLLNSIIEIGQNEVCLPEEENLLTEPITYFLNLGSQMHQAEVIRDFNGWSWDIVTKDISQIELNLAFQNFVYLFGHEFISEWMHNDSNLVDYPILGFEKLKTEYGEERAKKLLTLLCKLAIEMLAKQNKEQTKLWQKIKKESNSELKKLNNKKTYLENITQKKKELTKQIEELDKIINNKELLQKEYEIRNEKLPNKEKIFSIKHLLNRLETERQEYVDQIKQCNHLIDPKGYVARKDEMAQRVEFLDQLELDENNKQGLLDLCNLFLECFQINIAKAQTKQQIVSYFYILRYYRFLLFDEQGTNLKSIESLQSAFEKTIELLIEKAYKLNAIDIITDNQEVNYSIVRKLFDSKMIDLNHIVIETKVEDGKLFADYYDTNILDASYEIQSNKTVKLKKKTRLFI